MSVRGLGCPVRFILTAGRRGDAPQGEPLLADLPAKCVMVDTACDSDRLRANIVAKGAMAVIPNNPSRELKNTRSISISTPSDFSSNAASLDSTSSDVSPPASRRLLETTSPSSLSLPSSFGLGKCQHGLVVERGCPVSGSPVSVQRGRSGN